PGAGGIVRVAVEELRQRIGLIEEPILLAARVSVNVFVLGNHARHSLHMPEPTAGRTVAQRLPRQPPCQTGSWPGPGARTGAGWDRGERRRRANWRRAGERSTRKAPREG